jgi:hypothetical protein
MKFLSMYLYYYKVYFYSHLSVKDSYILLALFVHSGGGGGYLGTL